MRIIGLMMAGLLSIGASAVTATVAEKFKFDFNNADLTAVLKEYSEATGQKFLIDPETKGKITIMNNQPVTATEAFNQLSAALASNGIAITNRGDWMKVANSRQLQRSSIPVVTEVPAQEPEALYTWIISLKYVSADEVNKQVRVLTSRDGEMTVFTPRNQLIISDWSPNLQRVAKIIEQLDVKAASKVSVTASALPTGKAQKPAKTN